MEYIKIHPILGLKNNVPSDSPSLFKPLAEGTAATHCIEGINFDLARNDNSLSKAFGRQAWSNSANASATKCLGLNEFLSVDGTTRDRIFFDNGAVYRYDASRDPVVLTTGADTTFANDDVDLYSIINFGGYMIFSDRGEHTPYKWKNGDATLSKLLLSGTEYKPRYLMHLNNRILGAYTAQTNGDLDIRWSDALPVWATLDFPAANQIYKPEGDFPITGLGKLGHTTGFVFSEEDITRLDVQPESTPIISAVRLVKGWGSVNHHSIVEDGKFLYFYDLTRGFCRYDGVRGVTVISDDIENITNTIIASSAPYIMGLLIPGASEIAWTTPINGSVNPNAILFYNFKTNTWRMEVKDARYLDFWKIFTGYTWNDLILETNDVWPDEGTWSYYTSEAKRLVHGNTDGHVYMNTSEQDAGANWAAYRIEPILIIMGEPEVSKRMFEIWIDSDHAKDIELDFYWRGGDTAREVEKQNWLSVGSINLNDPDDPVLYMDQTARLHQIKWGTDAKDEFYSIPGIKIGYELQGQY